MAAHEHHVQKGAYENQVKTQAKYAQNELAIKADPELRRQWDRLKAAFKVQAYSDHKGVIRRTMSAERNLRPSFSVNLRRPEEVFHAAFDAFCLRWNLYGMQNDEPLLLKLAVNITPYGTMIHIPAYWSFDPKRDIRWDAIASLHRLRVPGRQGAALAEGLAERMQAAEKLRHLDQDALRQGLKGEKKHEFLCDGLGWDPRTSPKRLRLLRRRIQERLPKPVAASRQSAALSGRKPYAHLNHYIHVISPPRDSVLECGGPPPLLPSTTRPPKSSNLSNPRWTILPLPKGEGRGEGEQVPANWNIVPPPRIMGAMGKNSGAFLNRGSSGH